MADNPEDPFGGWKTVTIKIPDALEAAVSALSAVGNILVTSLNIALTVLNTLKSFAIGYTDPLEAILQAIITEIRKQINDLNQIGMYVTGDWKLFTYPFDTLRGGYSAYERRMISRLVNKKDQTRPNFSDSTVVLALFFYVSVPSVAETTKIARQIKKFLEFFNLYQLDEKKSLPVPVNLQTRYGLETFSVMDYKQIKNYFQKHTDPPGMVKVSWNVSLRKSSRDQVFLAAPTPSGFLVQVSTIQDGLKVFYERVATASPSVTGNSQEKVQLKEYGRVLDPSGAPLVLYGGYNEILLDADIEYNVNTDSKGNLRKGGARIFGQKTQSDPLPIPLELLHQNGKYYLQRTFFIPTSAILSSIFMSKRDDFYILLKKSDLPLEASVERSGNKIILKPAKEPPSNYYVRVCSTSDIVTDASTFQFVINSSDVNTPGKPVKARNSINSKNENIVFKVDRGETSAAQTITFPNNQTNLFLDSLTTALAVLFLSRSDLPIIAEQVLLGRVESQKANLMIAGNAPYVYPDTAGKATGLEGVSSLLFQMYSNPGKELKKKKVDPRDFRASLYRKARGAAQKLYQQMGASSSIEKLLSQQTQILRTWKWTDSKNAESILNKMLFPDLTILDSLKSDEVSSGLGMNPWCIGITEDVVNRDFFKVGKDVVGSRSPGFLQSAPVSITDEDLKTRMTTKEATKAIDKKPHLENFLFQYKEVVDGNFVFSIPEQILFKDAIRYGSADYSPVIYGTLQILTEGGSGKILFCRNVIDTEVYKAAATILNYAGAVVKKNSQDGGWLNTRLFGQIPQLDQLLQLILDWLKSAKSGVNSIIAAIIAYIEFLEARLLALQQSIKQIVALLSFVLDLNLGTFGVLPVVGKGTEGVLGGLLSASNKPPDGEDTYTAGFCLVMGGVPSFIVDLFGVK